MEGGGGFPGKLCRTLSGGGIIPAGMRGRTKGSRPPTPTVVTEGILGTPEGAEKEQWLNRHAHPSLYYDPSLVSQNNLLPRLTKLLKVIQSKEVQP